MATGVTGYFDLTGSYGITLRVNYTENYDAAANTSTLSLSLQFKSSQYYGIRYYLNGPLSVDGKAIVTFSSVAGTTSVVATALNTFATVPGGPWTSGAITHSTDGSKSVAVSVDVQGFTVSGGVTSGWRITGSRTVALTNIPRASTIGATDANIGATSMIAVNKKATAYTHSIAYKFGALTGYITESGGISGSEVKLSGTSIAFAVPTSFYAQIPNAKTGACTLTIKTYSGSTQIGAAQTCTFTVTAAQAACAPTVSGTVVDSNEATKALTGDANKLVRYFSNALCTVTAAAKNSATVAKKTVAGVEVTGSTRTIAKVETGSFLFGVTDSRGYAASVTVSKTLIAYIPLTCNVTVTRDGPTTGKAILKVSGNYFGGSFGAVSNALAVRYRVKKVGGSYGDYVSLTPTVGNGTWSASASLSGLDYLSEWGIEVTAADKLVSLTKQAALSRGIPVFDWGQEDFAFHVPVSLPAGTTVDGFITVPVVKFSQAGTGGVGAVAKMVADNWSKLPNGPWCASISSNGPPYAAVAYGYSTGSYGAFFFADYIYGGKSYIYQNGTMTAR